MKYSILIISLLSLAACKKEKLTGDSSTLKGTWNWAHSVEYSYDQDNDTILVDTVFATSFENAYSIEFLDKGKILFIENDKTLQKYRVVFEEFGVDSCTMLQSGLNYTIKLNNDDDNKMSGCVQADTLITDDYHLPVSKGLLDYPYYQHYYVK